MLRRLADLPLPVLLPGLVALVMFVPALHANIVGDFHVSRAFLYAGLLVLLLVALVALAIQSQSSRDPARGQFRGLVLVYLLLPPIMALPFHWAVPDTRAFNAWFEMVSSFTTTGATLYDVAGRLPQSVHLWRGLVGWLGGFFTLVTAIAILAPMNLGGFEVLDPRSVGWARDTQMRLTRLSDPAERLTHHALALFPIYALVTLVLWLLLVLAGDKALVAAMHAMAVLSTSGITSQAGQVALNSGFTAEVVIASGLMLALTRRSLPGLRRLQLGLPLWRDPEVRLGVLFVAAVPLFLFARHWMGAVSSETMNDALSGLAALWGAVFTVLSFLTTTGFESQYWQTARLWSGLEAPGLLLLGLAIMGGGVATTAGGVKLLRVHALTRLALREIDRLNYPSSVAGGGRQARRLRGEGAFIAFVFFILFAITLGVCNLALAATGMAFDRALVLSVAALTNTGPLADAALGSTNGYADLGDGAKAMLALTMVLGRVEALALLAFVASVGWRR
jgi:trk system potassium uptake protein TrkH